MSKKKKSRLSLNLRRQKKQKVENPSILKAEKEKHWSWYHYAIAFLLLYAGIILMNGCFSIVDLKAQENDVLRQTQAAQVEQKKLKNEASYMQTDEAIEKIAREDLKMVKPGEIRLAQRQNTEEKTAEDAAEGTDSSQTKSDEE